jgi:D-alanyl-D-alanine carboxypeptidase
MCVDDSSVSIAPPKRKPLPRPYSSKPLIKHSVSDKEFDYHKSIRTSLNKYESAAENKPPVPKPGISAKSWIIYDVERGEVFKSKKD